MCIRAREYPCDWDCAALRLCQQNSNNLQRPVIYSGLFVQAARREVSNLHATMYEQARCVRADCRYKLGASWRPQLGKPRGSGERLFACLFVFRLPRRLTVGHCRLPSRPETCVASKQSW